MPEETSTNRLNRVTPPAPAGPALANGADAVLRALEEQGVRVCFGLPGGAALPLYDAIARGTSIRHVLARHEQGAGHMAEAYARASGRVGVVLATSGARRDQPRHPDRRRADGLDPAGLHHGPGGDRADRDAGLPGVRHRCRDRAVGQELLAGGRAGRARGDRARGLPAGGRRPAGTGSGRRPARRPAGPGGWRSPGDGGCRRRARRRDRTRLQDAVRAVAQAIEAADRPVLYVGGGTVTAEAGDEVRALAEAARIPIVTTLMAKGVVAGSHPLNFGCPGMHGSKWANWALNMSDLLIAVGARFDDRVTGRVEEFAAGATVAHFDVDPDEIGKIRHAELPVLGDLRDAVARTGVALASAPSADGAWLRQVRGWRERFPLRYDSTGPGLKGPQVLERLAEAVADHGDVFWTTGVGQHQMWAMQYLPCERTRSFITSGGHGTMGFGLPAAIGARAARPGATVVCVDGDGSFTMTCPELATAFAERLPVIIVVIDNGGLGMVRQWQEMFYEERYSQVEAPAETDLAAVARGFGARGCTVADPAALDAALAEALASGVTCVIVARIADHELLFPMIQPGAAGVDVIEHPGR